MTKPLSASELAAMRVQIQTGALQGVFQMSSVSDRFHEDIVMGDKLGDFETVWQAGRLLHNMGRPEDAIFYLEQAAALEPDNPKARGRLVELYLDLHREMPNRSYDYAAYGHSCALLTIETSDYANKLYASVEATIPSDGLAPEVAAQ